MCIGYLRERDGELQTLPYVRNEKMLDFNIKEECLLCCDLAALVCSGPDSKATVGILAANMLLIQIGLLPLL